MAINWNAIKAICVVAICATTGVTAQAEEASLQGVWQVVEVTITGPGARVVKPHATLIIFSGKHYSRTEVHAEQPRPMLLDLASATADELRAVWGPFVGEAGTFELTGNVMTMQATVAKNPAAMRKGATSVYTYRFDGNLLTLTQVRTHAGPSENPVTVKLTRAE